MDSKDTGTPLKSHFHRSKRIGGAPPFPGNGFLSVPDSASGVKVLVVTVSKVGCNFWLVVVGMSFCRGKVELCGAKQV